MAKPTLQLGDDFTGCELARFALQATRNHLVSRTISGQPIDGMAERMQNAAALDRLCARAPADPHLALPVAGADALIAPPPLVVESPASECPARPDEMPPTMPVLDFAPTTAEKLEAVLEPEAEEVAA
jgi:hypothetical protein